MTIKHTGCFTSTDLFDDMAFLLVEVSVFALSAVVDGVDTGRVGAGAGVGATVGVDVVATFGAEVVVTGGGVDVDGFAVTEAIRTADAGFCVATAVGLTASITRCTPGIIHGQRAN